MLKTNKEGLKWFEWLAAAKLALGREMTVREVSYARADWTNGVDPTEWVKERNRK